LPGSRCLGLWLLRMAESAALGESAAPHLADGANSAHPPGVSRHLRRATSACRADAGPWDSGGKRSGREIDAQSRLAGDLGSASLSKGAQRPNRCGSRAAAVPARPSGSAVGHGYHRTPDPRGQGLLRSRSGHVQPACGGLVDRHPAHGRVGYQRLGYGGRAASAGREIDGHPQRPGDAVHIVDLHAARGRLWPLALDGLGGRLLRQRHDRSVLEPKFGSCWRWESAALRSPPGAPRLRAS